MTLNEFQLRAILHIAGNPAFRRPDRYGIYPDVHEWAERVRKAADAIIDVTAGEIPFDDFPDSVPP